LLIPDLKDFYNLGAGSMGATQRVASASITAAIQMVAVKETAAGDTLTTGVRLLSTGSTPKRQFAEPSSSTRLNLGWPDLYFLKRRGSLYYLREKMYLVTCRRWSIRVPFSFSSAPLVAAIEWQRAPRNAGNHRNLEGESRLCGMFDSTTVDIGARTSSLIPLDCPYHSVL